MGFGISFLFRKACLNKNCVVIKGPNPKEVAKSTYKHEGRCYQYIYITKNVIKKK